MLNLLLAPAAEKDLEEIYDFTIRSWGSQQAEKYQDQLFLGMKQLLKNPKLGKTYPYYAGNSYRKLHINKHLIFYFTDSENCTIVRILHDAVDVERHL
jgi:toxin ParE1/3/4